MVLSAALDAWSLRIDWQAGPVLIAGPTASGKSGLALHLAERFDAQIINADAIQIYQNWSILTARPGQEDLRRAPHHLYGHVPGDYAYSVGDWLRACTALLQRPGRYVVVGGTGLYFSALTEGLAEIPPTPEKWRARAKLDLRMRDLEALVAELDAATRAKIDTQNPMRVMRAWEVLQATGKGLAEWQAQTPPAFLAHHAENHVILHADKEWLGARIAARFDHMLQQGVMDEARANLGSWCASHPSSKAIGAAELIAVLREEMSLDAARDAIVQASKKYAKRQRTWMRNRFANWQTLVISP